MSDNLNNMRPCSACGEHRNAASMDCTRGVWTCMSCHRQHLARLAEAHEPEPAPSHRLPSGWWLLPALIVSVALWLGFFELIGVL